MLFRSHFGDTLDTINWMAMLHGEKEIAEVSRNFGYLMRFALSGQAIGRMNITTRVFAEVTSAMCLIV